MVKSQSIALIKTLRPFFLFVMLAIQALPELAMPAQARECHKAAANGFGPKDVKAAYKQLREHSQGEEDFGYQTFVADLLKYQGQSLQEMQNQSLGRALQFHGYDATSGNSRKALEELSQSNLARLQESYPYTTSIEMAEAEKVVSQIAFYFVHNTHRLSKGPQIPIFSSRQIERLGFRGGMNTYEFNRDLMGTDDNVFFRIEQTNNGKLKKNLKSPYGDKALVIDSQYAEKNGWISAYIMYPDELERAAKAVSPQLYKKFEHRLAKKYGLSGLGYGGYSIVSQLERKSLESLRNQLHLLDFTVTDFVQLQRERYLYFLNILRQNDPTQFQRTLNSLRAGRYTDIDSQVAASLPPVAFEFKVPVAVPPEFIL